MTMPLYFHSYLFASSEERVEKSLSVVINIFHKQFFSVGFSNTRFIVLTCSKYLLDFQKMKQTELPWETKKDQEKETELIALTTPPHSVLMNIVSE